MSYIPSLSQTLALKPTFPTMHLHRVFCRSGDSCHKWLNVLYGFVKDEEKTVSPAGGRSLLRGRDVTVPHAGDDAGG